MNRHSFVHPVLALAAFVASTSVAQSQIPKPLISELDAMYDETRLDLRAPGLIYGIVVDDKLAHVRAFGVRDLETGAPVRTDTAFRIASMTKMMTALLVHDLHDQGALSLDDPAEDYVPAMKDWKYPTKDSRKVTIRDLVNHTAGFITGDPWADRQLGVSADTLDEYLANADPFAHAPGVEWEYSNLGYTLLGRIIENVTGESFSERLRSRLLDPLGLDDTVLDGTTIDERRKAKAYNWIETEDVFKPEPFLASGAFDPLGGVWTNAKDYSEFLSWILSAWPARDSADKGPIPRHVVRSVTDAQRIIGLHKREGPTGPEDCRLARGYGMGFVVSKHCNGDLLLSHGGGFPGYGSRVILNPGKGWALFTFSNNTYAETDALTWEAAAKIIEADLNRDRNNGLPPDSDLLAAYEGVKEVYRSEDINGGGVQFAHNFFLDRPKERWNTQLAAIKRKAGSCDTDVELDHDSRLSGSFTWRCETARVTGRILTSPISPNPVQLLHLRAMVIDDDGLQIINDHDFH